MADKAAQLEACKAAASDYQSQLQVASTKDEALTLAISAAENLMKALKLSSDPSEKRKLKSQCGVLMDVADRIKKSADWTPPGKRQPESSKNASIGQWAANVDVLTSPSPASEQAASSTISAVQSVPQSALPMTANLTTGSPHFSYVSASLRSPLDRGLYMDDRRQTFGSLNDPLSGQSLLPYNHWSANADAQFPENGCNQDVQLLPFEAETRGSSPLTHSISGTQLPHTSTGATSDFASATAVPPNFASPSRIHRLAEPLSTRRRSKKEDIILLKASVVNGFKCPPWDKTPASTDFIPQEGQDLFVDTRDLSLSPYQQQFFRGWVRAIDAVPPPSLYPNGRSGIGPLMSSSRSIDLVQDAASDCSVVASLCAGVARAERGHDQMLQDKLYPFDKHLGKPIPSTNGKYIVRLNFNGCWRKVVIDDRLPVSSTHRLLHVTDRRNPALLWPALLEKAYLKVRGGYDFPGSNSCSDLWTFTGWIPEQVFLQQSDLVPNDLWKRIHSAFLYGDVLVTAGTGKMSTRQERELGLEGQHSYVILDMKETDHDRLFLIKNPWVEGKGWRGPRPEVASFIDSSSSGGDSLNSLEVYHRDSVPSAERPHPTTFWIGLEQVIQHFESLYLNWNPGLFRYRQDIHFEWTIDAQKTPGNCIVHHPQFSFSSKSKEPVWLLLSRHFRDASPDVKEESDAFNDGTVHADSEVTASGDSPKGYMSIYVRDGHGQRLYITEYPKASSEYVSTPQCLLRWEAEAATNYTVVVDQADLPPSQYTFSLSAFSNSSMALEPAALKHDFQRLETGAWTRQSAGGSTSSPKYFENPQYTLELRERTSLTVLLTSSGHDHPLHIKLALGYGKRLYRLQSRDVLADSGDHRVGAAIAEIEDLQPGMYTIICSLFEAGQTGDYTLRIDSSSAVDLKQIPRDGAGLKSMKLAPACFGANMHKIAAPLRPQRLASYTIVARFLKATSPRSIDQAMLARSPLRFSVEQGRGPERKFLIASERGEYADSATVRSESVHIDPAMVNRDNLWLVLDRLSGPGGPVEEWYELEIFTDMPDAYTVGVWRDWSD
ncbi:cysteine protease [Curvularia kusanoi]|uniref:Cysteine protease n=1 Tax=Curvularia kusanoi TaxID=90978 RepID=A0A9P4WCL6_CURKU|nr:cysteine protease [Curvularia kusanoi]